MTSFTVVWRRSAEAKLATFWLSSSDRNLFTAAVDELNRLLRIDPLHCGSSVSERLRECIFPPVAILFHVSNDDCLVTVIDVDIVV